MMDTLRRAATAVGTNHAFHDVINRLEAHRLGPPAGSVRMRTRVPMRVVYSHRVAHVPEERAPLVFDEVAVGEGKLLGGHDTCPICLGEYEVGEKGNVLPCKHGFHEQCIQEWTTKNPTCPICRMSLG